MDALKKGQTIAIVCLAIAIAIVAFSPHRMVALRYLAIYALVISAINIVLSHLVPTRDRELGQKLVLFASISIACMVVGALLLKVMLAVGLFLIGAGLLVSHLVVLPLVRKVRKPNAP
jgi:MFS family permease